MRYPNKLITVKEEYWLYIPDPDLIKSTYEDLLAEDPQTLFPFWAQLWPSSKAMASFLTENTGWIEGKQVLEIGAGLGLPSLIIAPYTKEIIISDHATDAIQLLEKNINYLGLTNARAIRIDWNEFPDDIHVDTLLLSDINYEPSQFQSLLLLIRKFLDEGTVIILSTPQRIMATPFITALEPFVRHSSLQTAEHMGREVEIRLLVLSS